MKHLQLLALLIFGILSFPALAQNSHKVLREGDTQYDKGQFKQAEEQYRKANSEKKSYQSTYNQGNAIYSQERFDEAAQKYEEAVNEASGKQAKQQAYYNLGNAYYQDKKLEKSIDAYREALRLNPNDQDALNNMVLAMMQQQQQQQQQEQNQDQQDQQQQNQDQQEQQQQQPQDQQIQNQNQDQDAQPKEDLSKDEAKQLLQIVEQEEKKVQDKMKKVSGDGKRKTKEW